MGSKALVLSFLLLLVGAALCSNIPQQELTWRAALTQVAARSAEPNDNEGEGSDGSGGGNPTPSASPTPIPPKVFTSAPYLSVPECANFAPNASEPLPAETSEQLQWRAMCELTCISITMNRGDARGPSYDLSFVGLSRFFSQTNPIWKVFSTEYETSSSGNCEAYNRVEECTRGCVAQRESRGMGCEDACGAQCRVDCPGFSNCPDRVNECYTSCSRTVSGPFLCRSGCTNEVCDDVSSRLAAIYPNMTNPGVAPSFRRNVDKIGTFYINPVRSPQIFGHEGNITALLFRVEDADNPGIVSYHLPLAERAPIEELDLSAWVCKRVNVSFSAVTFGLGLSEFSPATTLDVFPGVAQYPEQLTGYNLSSTPDVDSFGAYVVTIDWAKPIGVNLAHNYTITIRSGSKLCLGLDYTYTVDDVNITESVLRTADGRQFFQNCLLTVTIRVNPLDPGGPRPNSVMHTITTPYPRPSIVGNGCKTNWRIDDQTYDVNISWHMDALFLSGVEYFLISADGYLNREFFNPFPISLRVREDAKIGVTDYNSIYESAGFNHGENYEFGLLVQVSWKNRNIGLPMVNTSICYVSANPPNPSPVQDLQITSIVSHEKLLIKVDGLRLRRIVVSVNFNWTRPFVPFSSLTGYNVWLGPRELLADDTVTFPSNDQRIPANVTDSSLLADFDGIPWDDKSSEVFLQIQTFGDPFEDPLMSTWSTPARRSLEFEFIREDINVTCMVELDQTGYTVTIEWSSEDYPDVLAMAIDSYRIMVLDTDDNSTVEMDVLRQAENLHDYTILHVITPSLEERELLIDVAAVLNEQVLKEGIKSRAQVGNGNCMVLLTIPETPAIEEDNIFTQSLPQVSTTTNVDGDTVVAVSITFSWREPDLSYDNVSQYHIWFNTEPLPTGEGSSADIIPMISKRQATMSPNVSDSRITVVSGDVMQTTVNANIIDQGNDSSLILFLQMRYLTDQGQLSTWSNPRNITANIPPNIPTIGEVAPRSTPLATILGPIFAVIAAVLLVLIIIVTVYIGRKVYRQRQLRRHLKDSYEDMRAATFEFDMGKPGSYSLTTRGDKAPLLDDWEIPATEVIVDKQLGEGAFGEVYKGVIKGPLRNPKVASALKQTIGVAVAVKLLKPSATGRERSDFLGEIEMMKKIAEGMNPHVVNMVGCVTIQEPLCLILEFVPHGDLLSYLRDARAKASKRRRREKLERQIMERLMQEHNFSAPDPKYPKLQTPKPTLQLNIAKPSLISSGIDSSYQEFGPAVDGGGSIQDDTSEVGDIQQLDDILEQDETVSDEDKAAPYLEPDGAYSKLDAKKEESGDEVEVEEEEEEEEDPYQILGDLAPTDLMQFAYQIATGMEYLASLNIVHRDLACRNILVDVDKRLKITDFGLSREVEEVYVKKTKGRLPLKWMAIESIEAREFTSFSDVWSYGIVLWEIGTLGGFPYPAVPNQDLPLMLKHGYRLEKPDNCAPEVYEVMLECWEVEPHDRPSFTDLRAKFGTLLLAGKDDLYIDLQVDDRKAYYNADEEERAQMEKEGSVSSSSSEESYGKKEKKVVEREEKPMNPYVKTPAVATLSNTLGVSGSLNADQSNSSSAPSRPDMIPPRPSQTLPEETAPQELGTLRETPTIVGVPIISIVTQERIKEESTDGRSTNPYVDDPGNKQPLRRTMTSPSRSTPQPKTALTASDSVGIIESSVH